MPATGRLIRLDTDYDAETDVLYLQWGDGPTTHGLEVRPGVVFRLSDDDRIEGLTLYDVSRRFPFNPSHDLLLQSAALAAMVLADTLPRSPLTFRSPTDLDL